MFSAGSWTTLASMDSTLQTQHRTLRRPVVAALERLVLRLIDVVFASIALLVSAPVIAVAAVAIRRESAGPILFRQERVGRDQLPFIMWKLRTMHDDAPDEVHRLFVQQNLNETYADGPQKLGQLDQRITPVGSILRRLSIDELPQLVNVLAGDMSLVGPRPCLPWEAELFEPVAANRWNVLPGVTGLWQVNGRSDLSIAQMLELDSEYVRTKSLATNLRILLKTPRALHTGR